MSEGSLSGRRPKKANAAGADEPEADEADPREGAASTAPGTGGRRAGDKRERILHAAVKVFAKNGFYATRVSDVAKAAGVADGTIYLYFKSKDELLVSLFEDRVTKLLSFMNDDLPKNTDAPGKLRRVIEMQLGLLEGDRDLAEIITVILRQSTKLMKEYAAPRFVAYLDGIARIIAEGQAAGDFRSDVSPHLAARAIFGALDGIALTWALGKAEQDGLVGIAGQLSEMLLRGVAPAS